jgi:hypothetical protein
MGGGPLALENASQVSYRGSVRGSQRSNPVAAAEEALEGRPEIVLTRGAFRGVGVPDCVARGRAAAERVRALVAGA